MMKFSTACSRLLATVLLAAVAGAAAAQQAYPGKPIRVISPNPPGGSTTVLARLIGHKITESWGQQVLVENRPGGNSIIGTEVAAKSAPDGYTVLLTNSSHVITPNLVATPYDPIRDFAPVGTVVSTEQMLVLHPSVPANDLQQFIALAKSRPGELNYATSASGGVTHLAGELFKILSGTRMQHIPYKGGGPAVTDLIGGQVQLAFQSPINVVAHVKSGRLRAIAVSGASRLSALPQVPTFTEAGLPGFEAAYWQGVLAPAGTPKAIVDKLSAELGRILALPDIRTALASQGNDPLISTPDQFAALMKADMARYVKVIKTAHIKLVN